MIVCPFCPTCYLACEGWKGNRVRDPITENNLSRNRFRTILGIELNVKMISLDECIDSDAFILRIYIAFCGHHKGDLAWLEIEINWCEYCNESKAWVRVIISTVFSLYISIKVAFWDAISIDVGFREIWSYLYNEFSIGQHIRLREVLTKAQSYLKRSSLTHRQFYCLNHWMHPHLSDIATRWVYF